MARFTLTQLIGLRVETESKEHLGKISGVDMDGETHRIVVYRVESVKFLPGLFHQTLLVSPDQVISITEEKMVVADAVVRDKHAAQVSPSPA